MGAAQKNRGGTGVVSACIRPNSAGSGMSQVAHYANTVAKLFERLQAFREFKPGAHLRGSPFVHRGAMRDIDAAKAALGKRGRLSKRRLCGDHRIQKGKRQGDSHAAQKRPTRQMSFGDERHGWTLIPPFGCCLPCLAPLSLASETARSSRFPISTRRTGSGRGRNPASPSEPPACRNISFRGPLRTSAAFPSSFRRTPRDDSTALSANWTAHPLSCHPPTDRKRRC